MAKLKVYLAGPISNCNKKQRTEWRKDITKRIEKLGHICIDPAAHTTDTRDNWTPLREMVDIDSSDVVIANLWRESIGTVVGIVQARRKGKPVILIDQNYLDSLVLKRIVGESCIVHSIEAAVDKLPKIASQFAGEASVRKRSGVVEPFKLVKLHNSLNALCAKAGIQDAVLPELVAQGVHAAVKAAARNGSVDSKQIKDFVFDELDQLSRETDKLYEDSLKQAARSLKGAWEKYQPVKNDNRTLDELAREEKLSNDRIEGIETENAALRRTLQDYDKLLQAANSDSCRFKSVLDSVETAKQQFDDDLAFHKRALQSAADTPYKHPDKVYYALSLLARYVKARQECFRVGDIDNVRLDAWLQEKNCPFEYAPHESEGTLNDPEARKQRTVSHGGMSLVLEKHLKIGKKGDANTLCRIYFEILDSEGGKILIGHVGRHLKTA